MKVIEVKPYQPVSGVREDEVEIFIKDSNFRGVTYREGRMNIEISNCSFNKVHLRNEENINFENVLIQFDTCVVSNINISSIESNNIQLNFFNCYLEGKIANNKIKQIYIHNCFNKRLFISNQTKVTIQYTEGLIYPLKWLSMFGREELKALLTENQSIFIDDSKNVTINTKEIEDDEVRFGFYKIKNRSHLDREYRIGYRLSENEKNNIVIDLSIRESNIGEQNIKGDYIIKNSLLNSLEFNGTLSSNVLVERNKINQLYLRDVSLSAEEMLIYDLKPVKIEDSIIEIHKSNLNNFWFDNIDLRSYSILSFYRSRFAETSFTSCSFPQELLKFKKFQSLKNVHYPNEKEQSYYKDQYETFLQLKLALDKTGNFYEALKLDATSKEALRKINDIPKSDKAILYLNYFSNSHNLSIKKPFLWLIICSSLLYISYLYSIGRIFNSNDFDPTLIGYYFSFLDLTHKKDFLIPREEFTFWTLFIDFFNKVIVGYFIYQFIAAFRKYGKAG